MVKIKRMGLDERADAVTATNGASGAYLDVHMVIVPRGPASLEPDNAACRLQALLQMRFQQQPFNAITRAGAREPPDHGAVGIDVQ